MVALIALSTGACTTEITVPIELQMAPTQKLLLETHAVGVQIYICTAAKTNDTKPEWVLKAPDALLYDTARARVATHYAGPTWESTDGSKVVGKVRASATPTADAIPWLLLDVKSNEGAGVFSRVAAVQRLATKAGKAPPDGCSAGDLGKEARVPYKAVYRFYTTK